MVVVGPLVGGEEPVAGVRGEHEAGEEPLRGEEDGEERQAGGEGEAPVAPVPRLPTVPTVAEPLYEQVDGERRQEEEEGELGRPHVGDRVVDGGEKRPRREERQNPEHGEPQGGVGEGRPGRPPTQARAAGDGEQEERIERRGELVEEPAVLPVGLAVLHHHGGDEDEQDAGGVGEGEGEPRLGRGRHPVRPGHGEQHGAELNGDHAGGQNHVRRRDDLDVQAVGVVPPVVEGGRGDHGEGAPDRHPGAERGAETPETNGGGGLGHARSPAEGGPERQPAGGQPGEHPAEVDRQVRRGPEGVAADRRVPGDVPEQADGDARRAEEGGIEIPGEGGGALAGGGDLRGGLEGGPKPEPDG